MTTQTESTFFTQAQLDDMGEAWDSLASTSANLVGNSTVLVLQTADLSLKAVNGTVVGANLTIKLANKYLPQTEAEWLAMLSKPAKQDKDSTVNT